MTEGLLPLFPLEAVLLPHTLLPLHIYEERYREMIGACIASRSEFGVVQARGNGVVRIGCTAEVLEVVRRHDDGRFDILTMGRRRFRLIAIHSTRSFLEGEVDYFDDADSPSASPYLVRRALELNRELQQLGGMPDDPLDDTPEPAHPRLSFQLAQAATDLEFRQALLESRSESERMERVAAHLALLVRRRTVGGAIKKVARSNGHGKHLPEITRPE